jgi:hypothetical protein
LDTSAALLDSTTVIDLSFERTATIAGLVLDVFSVVVDGREPRIGVTKTNLTIHLKLNQSHLPIK